MKNLILGVLLVFSSTFVYSQGLEDIIVEQIPVTAAAHEADPNLPLNAIAYRVFVDMATGFEMQGVFGDPDNDLIIKTSTSFYNNEDGITAGRTMPNGVFNNAAGRFDSYITIDGVTNSRVGILKSEDNDGTLDGYTTGSSLGLQMIGADFESAFGTENFNGEFKVTDGAYNINGGAVGKTTNNRVLIGQFTTNGIFSFELNIQIRPSGAGKELIYIARNPTGLREVFPKLSYSSQKGKEPTVNLTSPSNGATFGVNETITLAASAIDQDGTITLVEFYVDDVKIGADASQPYQFSWAATGGVHQVTAKASDNAGNQVTSTAVSVNVGTPVPPTVSITSPANGAVLTSGSSLLITATANDADGSMSKVEFLRNGTKLGEDITPPYEYSWVAVAGPSELIARATDNEGNKTNSAIVLVTVNEINVPPVVNITAPVNNASFVAGNPVNIIASASDVDGSISKVEFFVSGNKIGEDLTAPFEVNWTAVSGTSILTAKATDNGNANTLSSAITISVTTQPSGPPAVSVTFPLTGAQIVTGTSVTIEATASDANGSVTLVEFLINGAVAGQDATVPYTYKWTAQPGIVNISARATDNEGNKTLSSLVGILVANYFGPTVRITSPVDGSKHVAGTVINITAEAADVDGSVSKVEFFVNGSKIGEDLSSPYQFSWNAVAGESDLTTIATDNQSNRKTSDPVSISVTGGQGAAPVVNITSPANNAAFEAGSIINIAANASDADGNVTLVEFFRNGTKIGEDNSAPYQLNWSGISGMANIAARATDNSGLQTTSAIVTITVNVSAAKKDTVIFDFSKAIISNNHYLLPVSINSNRDVTSFGFSTVINTAKITFHEVINHAAYLTSTNTFDQATKKLTVSSTATQAAEKNKKLISVSFTLVSGAIASGDLQQFQASINGTACESKVIFPTSTPVPPVVAISSPAGGASFTSGTSIQITATATDADGTVSKVEFFVNGTLIGEDATSPYQVNWTAIAGSASLTATASDNLGNQSTSSPVSVTVNNGGNISPVVSITSPVTGAEFSAGNVVSIAANASDPDGTIASVDFYVNDTKLGRDATTPYQFNWVATAGNFSIKAIATDNKGAKTTSAIVTIAVNAQPSISVSAPAEGAEFIAGEIVKITANAQDGDGNITVVEFFVNSFKVGQDETAPYEYQWTSVAGTAKIAAMVTDAKGAKTTSNVVTISVNAPPVIGITSPVNGAEGTTGDPVNIDVIATDADGSIAKVEFYVNNIKIGEDITVPYGITWTSATGEAKITAVATDNKGAKVTSDPVFISIFNPYEIGTIEAPCNFDKVCVPLNATKSVADVIGFDMVMKFDPGKVNPTGKITIYNDLINPDFVEYGSKINLSAGTITISLFLKPSAPGGTNFSGKGKLICVEFTKAETFGVSDNASFTMLSFCESYFTGVISRVVLPGKLTLYKSYGFTGTLKYWSDNSPIAYNILNPAQYLITNVKGSDPSNCSVLSATPVQPDLTGKFDVDIRNGKSIIIDRDILPNSEVQLAVNGMDAQLALKVSLGDQSFIPSVYQLIAMDANMDGVVSSGDISQINQRSILMIDEYKQAWNYNNQGVKIVDKPSKDWLFVNEKTVSSDPEFKISSKYPEPDGSGYDKLAVPELPLCHPLVISNFDNCPDIEPETYHGIMIGDVNGNYGGLPADGKLKKTTSAESLIVFDLSHSGLTANKMEFPVYFAADFAVTSLDFQLKFDVKKLVFDTIIMHSSNIQRTFKYKESDSTLRFTSYSLANYQANEKVLTIRFDVLDENISKNDFSVPVVESSRLVMLNGNVVPYTFTEYIATGINDPIGFSPEISIYPNPAGSHLYVDISEKATVEILDLNGRVLSNKTPLWANQKQVINLPHLANGIYMLRFQSKNLSTMRKLIIKR